MTTVSASLKDVASIQKLIFDPLHYGEIRLFLMYMVAWNLVKYTFLGQFQNVQLLFKSFHYWRGNGIWTSKFDCRFAILKFLKTCRLTIKIDGCNLLSIF